MSICRDSNRLMEADCAVLAALGDHFAFETAIGMNGRIWINAGSEREIILIANAIKNSEHIQEEAEIRAMVKALVQTFSSVE